MVSDPATLAEAVRFIDRHGTDARQRARETARALLSIGDVQNLQRWKRLLAAIIELEQSQSDQRHAAPRPTPPARGGHGAPDGGPWA